MPGRTKVAAPGEPACGFGGCPRPAGLGTDHVGEGLCRRHSSHAARSSTTPEPRPEPPGAEEAPPREPGPLARRLTGAANPHADPLAVLRTVLVSARRAGMPFGEAWALGAEAALSHMTTRQAREWWDALSATERAWADAYAREGSRLDGLQAQHIWADRGTGSGV